MRNWNSVVFAISYVTIYCAIFVLKTEQEEVNVCLKVITWKPLYYWAIQNRNIYLWYIFILMIFSPLSSIATVILVDNSLQKVFNRKTNGGRSIHLHLLVFFVFNMYASWYKIKPQKKSTKLTENQFILPLITRFVSALGYRNVRKNEIVLFMFQTKKWVIDPDTSSISSPGNTWEVFPIHCNIFSFVLAWNMLQKTLSR